MKRLTTVLGIFCMFFCVKNIYSNDITVRDADSQNEAVFIEVEESMRSDYALILEGEFDIDDDCEDLYLYTAFITLETDSGSIIDLIHDVQFQIGDDQASCNETISFNLETREAKIGFSFPGLLLRSGVTEEWQVLISFKQTLGNYENGVSIQGSMTSADVDLLEIFNGAGVQLPPVDLRGSTEGETYLLSTEGVMFELSDYDDDPVENAQGDDVYFTAFLELELTAFGKDQYLPISVGDSDLGSYGVGMTLFDATTGRATEGGTYTISSTAEKQNGFFFLKEGGTEKVTVHFSISCSSFEIYYLGVSQINTTNDTSILATVYDVNDFDLRTSAFICESQGSADDFLIQTYSATELSETTAMLNGGILDGSTSRVWFSIEREESVVANGTGAQYHIPQNVGAGQIFHKTITGLTPGDTYYFAAWGEYADGDAAFVNRGDIYSFTVPGGPPTLFLETLPATSIENTSANLNGRIISGNVTDPWIMLDTTNQVSCNSGISRIPIRGNLGPGNIVCDYYFDLEPGTEYFFVFCGVDPVAGDTVSGGIQSFVTDNEFELHDFDFDEADSCAQFSYKYKVYTGESEVVQIRTVLYEYDDGSIEVLFSDTLLVSDGQTIDTTIAFNVPDFFLETLSLNQRHEFRGEITFKDMDGDIVENDDENEFVYFIEWDRIFSSEIFLEDTRVDFRLHIEDLELDCQDELILTYRALHLGSGEISDQEKIDLEVEPYEEYDFLLDLSLENLEEGTSEIQVFFNSSLVYSFSVSISECIPVGVEESETINYRESMRLAPNPVEPGTSLQIYIPEGTPKGMYIFRAVSTDGKSVLEEKILVN